MTRVMKRLKVFSNTCVGRTHPPPATARTPHRTCLHVLHVALSPSLSLSLSRSLSRVRANTKEIVECALLKHVPFLRLQGTSVFITLRCARP